MLNKKFMAAFCSAMLLFAVGCGKEEAKPAPTKAYLTVTDAAKRQVTLEKQPQRVISLSPSFLYMIEAVDGKLVGRTTSKIGTIPESMKSVPEIGLVYNVNMETVVGLKPELVLAGKNQHDKFIPLLESNKIKVISLNVKTYQDVKDAVMLLGKVYNTEAKAKAACDKLDGEIKAVTDKLPKEKKRIVIMHATANSVTVEGSKSIAGCISDMLGFENVAAKALQGKSDKTPYSMETLVEQAPDLIFITSMGKPEEIQNRLTKDFQSNPAWNSLKAVKEGKVYVLPENLFLLNPGLKYPEAVKFMAKQVYPEAIK